MRTLADSIFRALISVRVLPGVMHRAAMRCGPVVWQRCGPNVERMEEYNQAKKILQDAQFWQELGYNLSTLTENGNA